MRNNSIRAIAPTLFGIALLLAALPPLAGCSLGFRNMHPGEESAIYSPLFEDIITNFDSPEWLWTRGTVSGDFNADAKVEEEAVIATIQGGDPRSPGPIIAAYLVICRIGEDGSRTAVARTRLFDRNPIAQSTPAVNNAYLPQPSELRHARAQVIPDKGALGDSIVVFFWGDERPCNVWFGGYKLKNGILTKTLDAAIRQDVPGLTHSNLDKLSTEESTGYQLIFPSAALPGSFAAKLGQGFEIPLWGHVFTPDADGLYHQDDQRFGGNYSRIEGNWNQAYLKALLSDNFEKPELAWFEYHLGMLNLFIGKHDMAKAFLDKAAKNSRDDALTRAIGKAAALLPKD